ncbi:MAG: DUF4956 domain-containing protein [Cellulosilyticaceae bacterium]
MHNQIFGSVFENVAMSSTLTLVNFLSCIGVAIGIGFILAVTYTYKTNYTKSFVMTLAMLPAVVCVIIMMVNGNLGAGVAVAGAFSLVRFRSAPGTAKEIGALFIAMGAGLATGMGYLVFGIIFALLLSGISVAYTISNIGETPKNERSMRITMPEDLDYTMVFEDLFKKYTSEYNLVQIKTTNMGSLFKLTYNVKLKNVMHEKMFVDEIRCRNGNLEITISQKAITTGEL